MFPLSVLLACTIWLANFYNHFMLTSTLSLLPCFPELDLNRYRGIATECRELNTDAGENTSEMWCLLLVSRLSKGVKELEKVQKDAARFIQVLGNLPYVEQLEKLHLLILSN